MDRCIECGFTGGHVNGCSRYPTRERPGDDLPTMGWAMCEDQCGRLSKRRTGRLCATCQQRRWRDKNAAWCRLYDAVRYDQTRTELLAMRKARRRNARGA